MKKHPEGILKPAKRPIELSVRLAWYLLRNRLRGKKRFPLVTMLEPLEMCNLACVGCGRIREYKPVLDKMMPVEVALKAVSESGAPIVSIAGGEPTIHPQIDQIINRLVKQRYFVYCCTNALLLERLLAKIPPSKYFCWVVHMDHPAQIFGWLDFFQQPLQKQAIGAAIDEILLLDQAVDDFVDPGMNRRLTPSYGHDGSARLLHRI